MKAAGLVLAALSLLLFIPMMAVSAIAASVVVKADPCAVADDAPSATTDCPSSEGSDVWASGLDCDFDGVSNPYSCQQALAEAAHIAESSSCENEVRGGTWRKRCLEFVARAYGYRAAGTDTAYNHFLDLKRRGLVHQSQTDIPAGALVFFRSGSPEEHVALYAGDGQAFSNDYVRSGCIDLTPMTTLGRGGRFLGWAPPVFPNGSRL